MWQIAYHSPAFEVVPPIVSYQRDSYEANRYPRILHERSEFTFQNNPYYCYSNFIIPQVMLCKGIMALIRPLSPRHQDNDGTYTNQEAQANLLVSLAFSYGSEPYLAESYHHLAYYIVIAQYQLEMRS